MARTSLGDVLPKLVRPPWRAVHEVTSVGDGYVCLASDCSFATRELIEVAGHVARHQYRVLENGVDIRPGVTISWDIVRPDTRGSDGEG